MTTPIDTVLSRLEKVRQRAPGQWSTRCPAHVDKGPSLSVRETPEGAVLLHCFAGCGTQSIVSAMGLDMADLFPPRATSGREPKRLARLLTPSQALELLDFEASLVVVAAGNVAQGAVLSPTDRERIAKAASRIAWLRHESSSLGGLHMLDAATLTLVDELAATRVQRVPITQPTFPPLPDEPPPVHAEPEWPEPMVPGVLRTPDIPATILPGAWGDMVAAVSRSTQTPTAISVLCALGVLGTLLQRRFEVDTGTHTEPLPIWCASVSPSGTRKTAVAGAFQRPLLDWEKRRADAMRREIARNNAVRDTAQKRIESLKLQAGKAKPEDLEAIRTDIENETLNMPDELRAPMLFVEDVTPETMQKLLAEQGGRMGVLSDEPGLFRILGGLYSGGGGASLEVFLKGHVGSAVKVHRANRSAFVDRPAVSMSLMVQPDLMADLAGSNQFRASGLMARFLWAVPVTNVGKRNVYDRYRIPNEVRDAYNAAVLAMLDGYPPEPGASDKPVTLRLDDCAEELWLDFAQEVEDQQGEGGPLDSIRDWTSKLPGAVARVAALLELAAGGLGRDTVGMEAMHQAITLAKLLIPHTKAAFNLLGADALESDAIAVLKWVRGNGLEEFTQREAQKGMEARFRSVDKLKRAIDKLRDLDCVRVTKRRNQGSIRPSVVIQVNPVCLS